ncbi:MAG: preprotein translocase, SecG subunit [Rhodospirillales bacterium]|jgi:preprotein translocase subunit SecG|nr:preprotein translocase, SecG subunit [Rhodospirillales bacterium]
MDTVLLVIHLFLAMALIGVVLLQRSEGGGLGVGSSGGMGSFMSVRGTANLLTRMTAILAGLFMVTSLALALLAGHGNKPRSLFDTTAPVTAPAAPTTPAPAAPPTNQTPATPPQQQAPSVPLSK